MQKLLWPKKKEKLKIDIDGYYSVYRINKAKSKKFIQYRSYAVYSKVANPILMV